MNSPILFIGYETSIRDEIREFLKGHGEDAIFTDNVEDTIKKMNTRTVQTVVLNMQRLEDAAVLRYINLHYQKTQVLLVPGPNLRDAIPALANGHYDLLDGSLGLAELQKRINSH